MAIGKIINKLRMNTNMSQEQFAELFGVSRQSVQKWESDVSVPEIDKLIKIAKCFDISLDTLILDSDTRITEELNFNKKLKPKYANVHDWESYSSNLLVEYQQSIDEGLDIKIYENVFVAVSRLPKDEAKKMFGDILFDIVLHAKTAEGYQYVEPSTLVEIKNLRKGVQSLPVSIDKRLLESKIYGAWMGRICGCLLGKTVEGIVVGGNIRCFLKLAGTEYFPDVTDKILLLEARSGNPAQIVTYFAQLEQLGVFKKVKGILLGTFTQMEREQPVSAVYSLLKRYINEELPVVKTEYIGHGEDSKAIQIGKKYKF